MLRNNISYVLLLLTFILSVLDFVKDWEEHKTSFRRWLFLIVTVAATLLAALSIRWTDQKDQENQREARNDKARLEGIIQGGQETASKAIGSLSDKVGRLETEVKTADLKKQVIDLQAELKSTQKALSPAPKAELSFTFLPYQKAPLGRNSTCSLRAPQSGYLCRSATTAASTSAAVRSGLPAGRRLRSAIPTRPSCR